MQLLNSLVVKDCAIKLNLLCTIIKISREKKERTANMTEIKSDSTREIYRKLEAKGIDEKTLQALDARDGNADKKISQSIFNEIEARVIDAQKTYVPGSNSELLSERDLWQTHAEVASRKPKANVMPNHRVDMGLNTLEEADNNGAAGVQKEEDAKAVEKLNQSAPNDKNFETTMETMQKFADDVINHYLSNGTADNFSFPGLPLGIEALSIAPQENFDDPSNDVYTYNNGSGSVTRNADSITILVTFRYNERPCVVKATAPINENFIAQKREDIPSMQEYADIVAKNTNEVNAQKKAE